MSRKALPAAPPAVRLPRRALLRSAALAAGAAALGGSLPRLAGITPAAAQATGCAGAGALPPAVVAVMQQPRYARSTWNLLAVDLASGETLQALAPDQIAFTGSVRKLFSVGLALLQLGADHRFTTPVYRRGAVDARGALDGDLILVGAGDLTLGGRLRGDDTLDIPDFDHNDANNLGTAILSPEDPLAGLQSLAGQVRAAGITAVGDVVVDDRLFDKFRVPNQNLLITPIMVNENMVDVTIAPTQVGQPATVDWRPKTAAFAIASTVTTGAAGSADTVSLSDGGRVSCIGFPDCAGAVQGALPLGYQAPLSGEPMLVQTFRIEEPADFARTAFIEALQGAGVTVRAAAMRRNPAEKLPALGSYAAETLVAQLVSPPYAEYARLILKVSLNLGANLSLMLFGLERGQRTIGGALAAERAALIDELGVPAALFDFPTNGSGSPDSRAAPRAIVQVLTRLAQSDVAAVYRAALPVLGVDGSLAHTGSSLPVSGHAFAKTGTTIEGGELKAQNLAGYIDARSGRRLAFALCLNDAGPLRTIDDVAAVLEDEAAIVNALYESC